MNKSSNAFYRCSELWNRNYTQTVSYTHLDVYKRQARSCGGETPRGAVGVHWDGDDVLLFLSDSWTKDTEARTDV